MPWKRMGVDEQRVQLVARAVSGKEGMAVLCREFGVSRPRGYLWRRRYERAGSFTGLRELGRRPHHSPTRTDEAKEQQGVELREETGWGAKKLHVVLREEQGVVIPVRTIHRILERRGQVGDKVHTAAPGRFERAEPNELWQMDTKGQYPLPEGECHPLSIVDDHSRYAVGLYALPRLSTEGAWVCLVETFRSYGVPQAMLMDRGTLGWTEHNGWGLTRLSVRLIEQGIRLTYGRICHPQTQGKEERFHRTLGLELRHRGVPERWPDWPPLLAAVRREYNERRPHEALGMRRPAEVYRPSRRAYQEQPREWEYPAGSEVRRVNRNGLLREGGRQWFVCESWGGHRVRIEYVDGKMLVSYRHMYIREIDLERDRTRPRVVERKAASAATGPCEPPVALRAPSGSQGPQNHS